MSRRGRTSPLIRTALLAAAGMMALTACGGEEAGPKLELTAALPDAPPEGTVLRVGDPATQVALEESGLIDDLDVEIEWANVTGGPKTLEAFRADAIDIGSVADIPPLFAHWTGTDVRIVAARETVDPEAHPTYELGVAPGVDVTSIEDLKGKKIAYSPGQAQGALVLNVLREAGLTQDDVEFVEMQSVDDSFSVALAGKQVDVAPLQQVLLKTYLAKYERDGATAIPSGVRDDAWTLYAPDHRARGRRQGRRHQGVRRRVGQGPAVDLRAPRRVRPGLLRRPRGPHARGRGVRRRGLRRLHRADQLGRVHRPPPGDGRHAGRRRRTRSRWTWRPCTTGASRRPSRPRWRGHDRDPHCTLAPGRRRRGRTSRPAPARSRQADPFGGLIGIAVLLATWVVGRPPA